MASPLQFGGGTFAAAARWLAAHDDLPPLLDVEMSFADVTGKAPFSVQVHTAPGERTAIVIDPERKRLAVDRAHSGQTAFHPDFAAPHEAPLRVDNGAVVLRFLLDASSIEVLAQGGETSVTELVFPTASRRGLSIASDGATPNVRAITIHVLRSPR
jgi:sucrose-6-phosphate hydrolase SacC (GH32 family)